MTSSGRRLCNADIVARCFPVSLRTRRDEVGASQVTSRSWNLRLRRWRGAHEARRQ